MKVNDLGKRERERERERERINEREIEQKYEPVNFKMFNF
jgi:hypothetical protein